MMISTKGRYALRVMLDLARGEGFVSLKDIADEEAISMKYLEAIVSKLNKSGLVLSHRGKDGGYRLMRPAGEISIAEILSSAEGTLRPVHCSGLEGGCDRQCECLTLPLWQTLDKKIEEYLSAVTLEDVLLGRVRAE
jgi:Rrf2 family protein